MTFITIYSVRSLFRAKYHLSITLLSAGLLMGTGCNQDGMKKISTSILPGIPDSSYAKGVSAPFCGVVDGRLVVAGGANFPEKPLLDGGPKKVYRDIWAFPVNRHGSGEASWVHCGLLPDSTAYGATFTLPDRLIFAGGNVCGNTSDMVMSLSFTEEGVAVTSELPSLPFPVEQAGVASCGDNLYLVGGQSGVKGLASVLRCSGGEWSVIASIPQPLVQCVAFCDGKSLYVWGGFNPESLLAPSGGYRLDLASLEWSDAPGIPDAGTFTGSTAVPLPDGRLLTVGGVNKDIFERALRNTPQDRIPYLSHEPGWYAFRNVVYVYDPSIQEWEVFGSTGDAALAGPGVAASGDVVFVAGGEIKPGVRSPRIFNFKF